MFNPLKYIKTNKALTIEVKNLTKLNEAVTKLNVTLINKATPELVIEKILKTPIEWYDPTTLPPDEYKQYYNEARAILYSPAFKNETAAYIKSLIEQIALRSKNHANTEALRYSINGVKALTERLEKIKRPEDITAEPIDPHNPI